MDSVLCSIGVLLAVVSTTNAWWPRIERVACGETGNFTLAPPFDGDFWSVPQCPAVIRPTYTLHTRSDRRNGQVTGYNPWSIPPHFNATRRTVFLIHGFHDSTESPWIRDFVESLLTAEDFNLITVDWRRGADVDVINYGLPASNTRTVGAQTALVMRHLVVTGGTTWGRLWCMGHSLGAHVCGLAGMETKERGGEIGRVTGFDPAGPYFEQSDVTAGVNPSSAKFVDIIHTTAIYGTTRALGHMDFYPSDGKEQDGCRHSASCSHSRSKEYFRESITNDCFLTTEICTDVYNIPSSCRDAGRVMAKMGFRSDVSGQYGIYRLDINRRAPFCKGAS